MLSIPAWSGQVVTPELRDWARQVVDKEKKIDGAFKSDTLGVTYFDNLTGQPELEPLRKRFTLMLITDFAKIPDLIVVERVKLQGLVEEMRLSASRLTKKETAVELGSLLGARWFFGGDFNQNKKDMFLAKGNHLDVPSQKVVGQADSSGVLGELFRLEKDILFETLAILNVAISPE
jgi:TolB-like protein